MTVGLQIRLVLIKNYVIVANFITLETYSSRQKNWNEGFCCYFKNFYSLIQGLYSHFKLHMNTKYLDFFQGDNSKQTRIRKIHVLSLQLHFETSQLSA